MSDGFYRAFEEKHRGSRELIKSRLRAYLPFVTPLAELNEGSETLDLGCGRGEWIEILTEVGFKSHGVDLDEGMLGACVELGLSVEQGDAIGFLAALPDESQTIISAFHFVEHISFEQLQNVISEALRVLRPGGLLIMETPNPENIVVSTCNFYLDPTHLRPIPPQLLSFLPEFHGFERIKTIRLQESKSLMQSASLTLQDVLGGVSPDYAVIAQKNAAPEVLQKLNTAFEDEYGLSLDTLTIRYTAQLDNKMHRAEDKAVQAYEHAQQAAINALQAEVNSRQADAKAAQAQVKAAQAQAQAQQAEAKAGNAQTQANEFQKSLHAVMNSRSWRITAPLRWCGSQMRLFRERGFKGRAKGLIKTIARPLVRRSIALINARPDLRNRVAALAQRVGMYAFFRSIYWRFSVYENSMRASASRADMSNQTVELPQLTPRAREIYAQLRADIENKRN